MASTSNIATVILAGLLLGPVASLTLLPDHGGKNSSDGKPLLRSTKLGNGALSTTEQSEYSAWRITDPAPPGLVIVIEQSLPELLRQFAKRLDLTASVSHQVSGLVRETRLPADLVGFMTKLTSLYDINWFVHDTMLHVGVSNDIVVDAIPLQAVRFSRLVEIIGARNLIGEGFEVMFDADANAARVTGTPQYISEIAGLVSDLSKTANLNQGTK